MPLSRDVPYFRMRRDLGAPIMPAPLPPGVVLVPFDERIAPACRELMNRVYAEGFGDAVPFETWWPRLVADPDFDPALCYVAANGAAVVGYCQTWIEPFIKDLVVDRAFRRSGLGAALMIQALTTYAARNESFVDLKTDVDNLVAQSLYRRLGFVVVERVG
ncbi:MAG: GNAT family N-acetyltransferase [Devosia nanyangense]|uniref:GNAT family N-acetyltransferase n=1 Tax=Devosia nanyangense TaxID=1228055 RepID=A0A933KYP5_9HYPH|nr:GNAT family N-acetyltransferase [Devosia nanyangense]